MATKKAGPTKGTKSASSTRPATTGTKARSGGSKAAPKKPAAKTPTKTAPKPPTKSAGSKAPSKAAPSKKKSTGLPPAVANAPKSVQAAFKRGSAGKSTMGEMMKGGWAEVRATHEKNDANKWVKKSS